MARCPCSTTWPFAGGLVALCTAAATASAGCGLLFGDPLPNDGGAAQGGGATGGAPVTATGPGGAGGGGGAASCEGRTGDDDVWFVTFSGATVTELRRTPSGVVLVGRLLDGASLPGIAASSGDRLYVASVSTSGCGFAAHDLGPADGDDEAHLTHGGSESFVAWTSNTKLCAAPAAAPGAPLPGACTGNAVVDCDGLVRAPQITGDFVTFETTVDTGFRCTAAPTSVDVNLSSTLTYLLSLTGDQGPQMVPQLLNLQIANGLRFGGHCTTDAPGHTCRGLGTDGSSYGLSAFLGATITPTLPPNALPFLRTIQDTSEPNLRVSAHGEVWLGSGAQGARNLYWRLTDNGPESGSVALPAGFVRSADSVGTDELLVAGTADGAVGPVLCTGIIPAPASGFWAIATVGGAFEPRCVTVERGTCEPRAGLGGAVLDKEEVIYGGQFECGHVAVTPELVTEAVTYPTLLLARVPRDE